MIERSFQLEDQIQFAELSGDFNPMHIDPVYARRLIYGKAVVHGIHSLLWSMNEWIKQNGASSVFIDKLTVSFNRPIGLNERVVFHDRNDETTAELHLLSGGMLAMKAKIEWHAGDSLSNSEIALDSTPQRIDCCNLHRDALLGRSEQIDLMVDRNAFSSMFADCYAKMSSSQYAVILATTRIVGVHCPGLNSVFQGLSLAFSNGTATPSLTYSVSAFDKRFNLATISLEGGPVTGGIKAFYRPPIKQQRSVAELQTAVGMGEFSGQKAVVVGGSRGLGEVTAKLLAVGGADVKITYVYGEAEAQKIVADIRGIGLHAEAFHCDVNTLFGKFSDSRHDGWMPTHIYFLATPFIFCADRGRFSPDIFDRFCRCYITGFMNCVNYFKGPSLTHILYPSSAAVDELPVAMGEYAAAKTAGETLCNYLEKTNPALKILKPRIPRMDTDQTASLYSVHNNDPVPIMLDYLREMARN